MEFRLRKNEIACAACVPITATRYAEISVASDALLLISKIEESWDNLIKNFIDIESEIIKCALDNMVISYDDPFQYQDNRLNFSRLFNNFLSSSRAYIDHTPHHISSLERYDIAKYFNDLRIAAYDGSFEYRFIEALRNYSQHRGLPIHGTSYLSSWINDFDENGQFSGKGQLRHTVTASINLKALTEDKKFKRSVAAELSGRGSQLDVSTCIRLYVEALGRVHMALRLTLKEITASATDVLTQAIRDYGDCDDGNTIGLHAEQMDDNGNLIEAVSISRNLIDWIERLTRRNRDVVNLSRRYATNEIIPPTSK
ncbi:hypothetical protein K7W03_25730 [Sphingobium sp. PNB]|uniref:hypothetical protein n=1 Tax=Sphingobium sp. PNB TaxID=863934 RepID=UPI001CA3EA50|nr:hypothetical protein [Sphingobium sp. PNB]MCB4862986.1 hypothetical protein [Sphingobium sp. PNB]